MPHILGRRPHTRFFRGRSSTRIEPPFSHVLIYQWQEEVEDLEGYHVGGYHPVRIGDVYSDGRYRVVHKLGFGSYSTVWLARDSQLNRYVALKIIVAEASKDTSENRILRHLQQTTGESSIRHRFVTSLLDEFYLDGPNGRHLCLATEPARCSIAASKEGSIIWMFPLEVARAISAQAILGLQSIHSRGVIHGGKERPRHMFIGYRLTLKKIYTLGTSFLPCLKLMQCPWTRSTNTSTNHERQKSRDSTVARLALKSLPTPSYLQSW